MKEAISIFVLMLVVAVMTTSCVNKHYCAGLKAHPNYKSSWAKK